MMRRAFRFSTLAALVVALVASGCLPFGPSGRGAFEAASIGTTARGLLVGAAELPADGAHHRCYRRAGMRFAVPQLVGLVERAAARVADGFPGSALYVGEMSAKWGGDEAGHASHESGRDVDLAFYAEEPGGRALTGFPVTRFDRYGAGIAGKGGRAIRFDAARNWELVEALLADEGADVQWIFASDGVKALLLRWAVDRGRDREIVMRAATALHQPSDSAPHDDHFHVRIYCPEGAGDACVDVGPVWPWIAERRAVCPSTGLSDDRLAAIALEGI
jgi:penicillin-insensitive murein DD-endopeptidase